MQFTGSQFLKFDRPSINEARSNYYEQSTRNFCMKRSNLCLEGEWLRLWSELTCGWGEVTGGDRIPTTSRVGKTTGLPWAKIDQDFMQCYCLPSTYPKYSWVSSQPPAWVAGKICPKNKTFTWKQIACNPYLGLCLASAWPWRNYTSSFSLVWPPFDRSTLVSIPNIHPADQL